MNSYIMSNFVTKFNLKILSMKKILAVALLAVLSLSAMAGNDNEDVYYGPQAGSFSISFSALPVVDFVGNMFNGTQHQSFDGLTGPSTNVFEGATIDMKFFTSDRFGVVVGAGLNCFSQKRFQYESVPDDEIIAQTKNGVTDIMLTFGAQYVIRPGRRLQPVIATRLVYAFDRDVEKFTDFDNKEYNYKEADPSSMFGLVMDLGVECFLSKNISLSAYADLGFYTTSNKEKMTSESEDYSKKISSSAAFGTGMLGGNLALNFYF